MIDKEALHQKYQDELNVLEQEESRVIQEAEAAERLIHAKKMIRRMYLASPKMSLYDFLEKRQSYYNLSLLDILTALEDFYK